MKSFLQENNTEMYSIHNEQKSAIAERFIRSLKYKIYKYISSKQLYIDTLDDTVKKFNNTYDVKPNTYINSGKDINNKNPKFENVILLGYQNIKIFLQMDSVNTWSELEK